MEQQRIFTWQTGDRVLPNSLFLSLSSRLDSLPRDDGGGRHAGWPGRQTGKKEMPHHITFNQCCLRVPLLLCPGIRILPLLPPYLRPRVGSRWICSMSWRSPVTAQLLLSSTQGCRVGEEGRWGDVSLVPSQGGHCGLAHELVFSRS